MHFSSVTSSDAGIPSRFLDLPLLVSAKYLAVLTDKSVRTIYRDHAAGLLPSPVKAGRVLRWRGSDIINWIEVGCPTRDEYESLQ